MAFLDCLKNGMELVYVAATGNAHFATSDHNPAATVIIVHFFAFRMFFTTFWLATKPRSKQIVIVTNFSSATMSDNATNLQKK